MLLNPVAIPLGFLLLELSAAFHKRITPCSFKGFLSSASGTLHPPGLPPHSLAGPHPWLVLLALISPVGLYVAGHLRTQRWVLFSPLSTLSPLVMIASGLVALNAIHMFDDSQICVSGQDLALERRA